MTKPELSAALKAWRASLNLTQPDAASTLGVPCKTYKEWEQARHMPSGLGLRALLEQIEQLKPQ